MSATAFVFPGQGAQYPGMGYDLYEESALVREYFARADAALGYPLSQLCFQGPAEELTLTQHAQPAIVTLSCAIAALVQAETGIRPAALAGLSLGEYSALVIAGMLEFEDALRLVARRGMYMQEAVPPGSGGMAAIFGLEASQVEELCRQAGGVVEPANYNCPGQLVVSGVNGAVTAVVEAALAAGARRAFALEVSAPFHCSLLEPAAKKLEADLAATAFYPSRFPVLSAVDGTQVTPERIRDLLARQVVSPVRWQQCVENFVAQGITTLIEMGPGKVLSGLIRKTDKNLRVYNVEKTADLNLVKAELAC